MTYRSRLEATVELVHGPFRICPLMPHLAEFCQPISRHIIRAGKFGILLNCPE
jgi:hypothetical protein